MSATIRPEDLGIEIAKNIAAYTEEVAKAIEIEVDETSKKVLAEIKSTAPKRTGKYARGFTSKKQNRNGEVIRIIHNRSKPGLVHLKELGHAKRGGGRVSGTPHVQPAYDKFVPAMESNIEKILSKGGK